MSHNIILKNQDTGYDKQDTPVFRDPSREVLRFLLDTRRKWSYIP